MSVTIADPSGPKAVSQACIDCIKRNEGCKLTAYQDVVGVWTIGFGDTLGVKPGMRITQAQAEASLMNRLANEFTSGVLLALGGARVTQSQLDAMVSLSWNIGVGAFKGSTVCKRHRLGDYTGAADAFLSWNKAGGKVLSALVRRRQEEREMYLNGGAPQAVPPGPAMTGPILAIQEVLVNAGFLPKGHADGDFFKETKGALNALLVQQSRGLTLDQIP